MRVVQESSFTDVYAARHTTLQQPALFAVNLGSRESPSWYAPEELQIMPFQLHQDLLRPTWTAAMINTACIRPYENAALIEVSGMETLGFARNVTGMTALVSSPTDHFNCMLTDSLYSHFVL